jgi:HAE1 family hydrophobic/amphiphilic exporter-1
VNGAKNVYSSSQNDVSILSIDFHVGTNLDDAIKQLKANIAAVQNKLPAGADSPDVERLDINAQPVLTLGLTEPGQTVEQMRELADLVVVPALQRVQGVAQVEVLGGEPPDVSVQVHNQALYRAGITITDVVNSLRAAGQNIPGGTSSTGTSATDVRLQGAYDSITQIEHVPILSQAAAMQEAMMQQQMPLQVVNLPRPPLTIADVATVGVSHEPPSALVRINGQPGITLIITKSPGNGAVSVVNALRASTMGLQSKLPTGTKLQVLRDNAQVVQDALDDVDFSLLLGAALAMTVILLFLHNLRGTIIVSLAIPACVLATFGVMSAAGFTLNQMTLLALSLSVGILVDDSIVVLEAITRHLHAGESPMEAALNGRAEIGFSGLAITLVDVVVFAPIAFMGGIVGGFFKQFGLCVVTATLFSLVVSFTVTPVLAARWYRPGERLEPKGGLFARLEQLYKSLELRYRAIIVSALQHRAAVLGGTTVLLLVIGGAAISGLGFEFIPGIDQGQVVISIEMPPGSSLAATDAAARRAEVAAAKLPEVQSSVTTVGKLLGGFGTIPRQGSQYAQIALQLRPKAGFLDRFSTSSTHPLRTVSDQSVATSLRTLLASQYAAPGERISAQAIRSVIGLSQPVDIQLRGPNPALLVAYAAQVRKVLSETHGVLSPDVSVRGGRPELVANVDAEKAAVYHIPQAIVGQIIRYSISGEKSGTMQHNGRALPVIVNLANSTQNNAGRVGGIPVGTDSGGQPVTVADVAHIVESTGPANIERSDGERLVEVTADLAPNAHLGNIQQVVQQRILALPHSGIRIHWSGDAEAMNDNAIPFVLSLGIALLLVYFVTATLFNSLTTPLVIMFTLPMALVGAFAALALTGETMSLVAAIGIIMLSGLMGRNAILLLDYTNALRQEGYSRAAALEQAGATRLRPILMTTIATIIGMLPVALRIGRASEIRAPMATVVIGGLVLSTMLTLVVIPIIYTLVEDLQLRVTGRSASPTLEIGEAEPRKLRTR